MTETVEQRLERKAKVQAVREHAARRVHDALRWIELSSGPLKTVLELHAPVATDYGVLTCGGCDQGCNCDRVRWPCRTWQAATDD